MGFKKKLKKASKKVKKSLNKENGGGGGGSEERTFSIPYETIEGHLSQEQKGMFCTSNPNHVYVRYKQPSCDPDSINTEDQLDICVADKDALQNKFTARNLELEKLKEEISSYVPIDTVNSIMNDKFCTPYSQLNGKFNDTKGELGKCQTAYDNRTEQLNKVYERYKDDVKKYHETIKTIIDSGDTSVIKEEKQQIYKEESLMLQEKIRKNWRKLYIVLVILIVVMVLCILKFFDFI